MQFNENFVVRNGLEVANNLIFADIATNKVGIGTTVLTDLFNVAGKVNATSVSVAQTLSAYISSFSSLKVSGISSLGNVTIGNGATDFVVNGTSRFSGIVTVGNGSSAVTFNPSTNTISGQNINVTGIVSSAVVKVASGVTINSSGVYANSFYGDGTGLYGIVNAGGMTVYYNGSPVGYAATIIDFSGTGISTVPFSSGIATITINKPDVLTNSIISGVATITTGIFTSSLYSSGVTSVVNLYSSGVTTLGITSASSVNVSGATTTNSLNIGTSEIISSTRQLKNITSLDATTLSTIESAIADSPNDFTNINVSGASTLGSVSISSGVVTATSGVVTYYGDGSKLSGLPQLGIGIQSGGTVIGSGITTLNFIGLGNTFKVSGNTVDISISSGSASQWQTVNLGIVTTTKVGIGTTIPRYILEVGAVGMSATTAYVNGDLNSEGLKVLGNTTITGVSTLGITSATNLRSQTLNVSGIATIGILTASSSTSGFNLYTPVLINYSEKVNVIGNTGASCNINLANGTYVTATLNQTTTFTFTTGITTGAIGFALELKNGTSGPFTITWPTSVKWPNNTIPTRTTTDSKTDVWVFNTTDNGTTWLGNLALYNYT